MALGTNNEALLGAMMGVIAIVWSIGFVAYNFIWNYFWGWAKDPRNWNNPGVPESFLNNRCTYLMFVAAGAFAAVSIVVVGGVLAAGDPGLLPVAWSFFVLSVGSHALLFTREINSSIRKIDRLNPDLYHVRGGRP